MQKRQAALSFILVTVLIDMIGIGIVIPVLPRLVAQLYGGTPDQGALAFGWFIAIYALMQFACSPIIGKLSDAYGRRPVLLISLLGAGLDYLLLAFAPTWQWLFLGRVIAGITGANITTANAYIADISTPDNRAKNFGLIGAAFGIGFIIGPALGGWLGQYDQRLPFLVTAGMSLLNWLYGLLVLPESLARENRRPFTWANTNPFSALRGLRRFPLVFGLTATFLLERIAHDVLPATWVLYTTWRFNWTERDNGLSLALVGLMYAIVSAGLTGKIVAALGEKRAAVIGLLLGALTFVGYGLASQGWMLLAFITFGSLSSIAMPALQAIITKHTPADQQGTVQGALTSIHSLAAIIGPLVATSLFGYFTAPQAAWHLPGAAFLAGAVLILIGALNAFRVLQRNLDHVASVN
jgi:DHA1 family tetracycline resistance protein-like MFS transporter